MIFDPELMDKIMSPDFRIYGWSAQDILDVQHWMKEQNVTLKDLKCSSIRLHYWEKQKVTDMICGDFR